MNKENSEQLGPFRILPLIKSAQQKHGLRHENYQRYRGYCTRKIERIRKSLKFMHSYKCVPNRAAKFIRRDITPELSSDMRFLQIVVFEVERNWAYAMQMKYESMEEPLSRKKFHMKQKLRRAVKCALFLESLVEDNRMIADNTHIEIKAYTSFIYASLSLELKDWKRASNNFEKARLGYMELHNQVKDNASNDVYATKIREVENLQNLCRSQSGDADLLLSTVSSMNLNASEEERKPTSDSQGAKLGKGASSKESNKQRRKMERLAKEPQPIKPFFFDLALNFVEQSGQRQDNS